MTGSYGERGMDSFRSAATEFGICVDGDVHKINRKWTDGDFRDLLLKMRGTQKARGVVMFVDEEFVRRILTALDHLIRDGHTEMDRYFWSFIVYGGKVMVDHFIGGSPVILGVLKDMWRMDCKHEQQGR